MTSTDNQYPAMTPEMRSIALQKLILGEHPTALGTVLPSPRPEYLQVLYMGSMDKIDLYLTTRDQDPNNPTNGVNDNDYTVYFDEWSVEHIVDRAMVKSGKQPATDADDQETEQDLEDDRLEKIITVRRIQNRTTRQLNALKNKAHNWNVLDDLRERKHKAALELIVNDPVAQQPGALKNLVTHWRNRLGWIDSQAGYRLDATTTTLSDEQKFRFIAYAPVGWQVNAGEDWVVAADEDFDSNNLVKYIWSDTFGVWKTEDEFIREQQKIKQERNAWLTNEINRVEREFYDDLVMDGVEFVQRYMTGGPHEVTNWPTEVPMSMSGEEVRARQKKQEKEKKKAKKQTPRRGLGPVSFVPEDGGLMPLQRLSKAATAVPNEEGTPEFLQGLLTTDGEASQGLTPALEVSVTRPGEEVNTKGQKGKKAAKKTGAAKTAKTASAVKKTDTKKRKRGQNEEADAAPATTRVTRSASAQPVTQPQTLPTAEPTSAPPSPKKKRKVEHTAEQEPELVPTRKSSRIAKRKADSMEPEEPTVANQNPAAAEKPAKKRKTDAKPTVKKESRQRTVSAEPQQPKEASPKAHAAGQTLSAIAEVDEPESAGPQRARAGSKSPSVSEDLASLHTTPQLTPHRPTSTTLTTTSITAADYPAVTDALRKWLVDNYPFLTHLSTDASAQPSRLDDWLSFLSFFGKDDATVDKINGFFGREGAAELEGEYLGELKKVLAGVRRVVGEDEKFVWV